MVQLKQVTDSWRATQRRLAADLAALGSVSSWQRARFPSCRSVRATLAASGVASARWHSAELSGRFDSKHGCSRCSPLADGRTQDSLPARRLTAYGEICRLQPGLSRLGRSAYNGLYPNANGHAIYHTSELYSAARGPSAAVLVTRAIFRRAEISGIEAHDAHAGSAHGVRKRALP